MKKGIILIKLFVICMSILSFQYGVAKSKESISLAIKDTLPYQNLGKIEKNRIIISETVDLNGSTCRLPKEMILQFKGGIIRNGTLIGNMTKIECKGKAFDKVTIKGSWNIPNISTKMFADLRYENALRDVMALTNPNVKNIVVVEKGNYTVSAKKGSTTCIPIVANTEITLNGIIRLEPNQLSSYNIIFVKGNNIVIKGKCTIIGDKHAHHGSNGEWGMGINLRGAVNTSISGLTIRDCWGDCIYVGGNSKNVHIENCKLDHGRRQGISITKADGVTIRNCKITNVGGTAPEYAIDVEPNANDTVDNILIENVIVKDCKGGFLAYKALKPQGTTIGNIVIRDCTLSVFNKYPICLKRSQRILVEKCTVNASNAKAVIITDDVQQVSIRENFINIKNSLSSTVQKSARRIINKKNYKPIQVNNAVKKVVESNIIIGI